MTRNSDEPGVSGAGQDNANYLRESFRRFMGIKVDTAAEGVAELSMTVDPFMLQSFGSVHGGVYATLIDSAIAHAVRTTRADGKAEVTIDLNVTFLKAVSDGSLRAIANAKHSGRSIMIGNCEVFNATSERVALGKAVFFFKNERADPTGGE